MEKIKSFALNIWANYKTVVLAVAAIAVAVGVYFGFVKSSKKNY